MESIRNVSNKSAINIINSTLKTTTMATATTTATTTAASTSPGASESIMTLHQRIAKRRRDWNLDLTNGPVSSPAGAPESASTPLPAQNARLQSCTSLPPQSAAITSYSSLPLPPPSTSSKDVINDEYPLGDDSSEEYAICPDTDSLRYKQESDVGLWSGPRSSPGPKAKYARSRSWSSRRSDSGYSSGGEEPVVVGEGSEGSDSESDSGLGFFLGFPDDKFVLYDSGDNSDSEFDSDYDSEDDDIVMTDSSPLGNSGDGDIVMAEYDGDDDVVMADVADVSEDDDDILMPDYIEDNGIIMADYSEDVEVDMTDYIALANDGDNNGPMFGWDSPSELRWSSPPASPGWSEPEVLSGYTATNWDNGVPELVRYLEFDYSDIEYDGEYDGEIPIVVISLAKDEKDYK
ncbi:hypothetical protein BDP81DRAFT_493615 [Colletotrichum phormii]|uniref:Uncharacterized protein n=1 Tax=Colletotrichum phormii TaxID=359342 RepID=A0AAI9ZLW2_9PEZI|nr:uncharacterized protein BDP81DRAFT_493615 [Colletotrichum phormii]KAK1634339.1 hypothetical protein BDP81DRAFT_493615 [Colletotrichum phormii]